MYNFESVCGAKSEQVVAGEHVVAALRPSTAGRYGQGAVRRGGGSAAARTPAGSGHRQDGVIHIPRSCVRTEVVL